MSASAASLPQELFDLARIEAIPLSLRNSDRWLCWRYELVDGKWTKVPLDPRTLKRGSSTDMKTWAPFSVALEVARRNRRIGLGFALGDGFAGIDIDSCIDPGGCLHPTAKHLVERMNNTYTERSVSGLGIHILYFGSQPGGRCKGNFNGLTIEMYDGVRFLVITGDVVVAGDLQERTTEVAEIHRETFPEAKPKKAPVTAVPNGSSDEELIRRIRASRQGHKFDGLWSGDISAYGDDESRADLGLCSILAFWTNCDASRIDSLYRQSGLMREKWNRADYRERTIQFAIDSCSTSYSQSQPLSAPPKAEKFSAREWPAPLTDEALQGITGDFVRTVLPHTESDPASLVLQFLTVCGNYFNRSAYYQIGGDRHYPNLFAVVTADSSKGRKGTSYGEVNRVFEIVDRDYLTERKSSGLSTGEGLLWAVRDPIIETVPVKNGKEIVDYKQEMTDPGVPDKRLLAVEGEFGQALQTASRDGNTLSAIVRLAWDGGTLRVLTKSAKAVCREPHISIIGHITITELSRLLSCNDSFNGFANRFLWVCSTRSKYLPFGGSADQSQLQDLASRIRVAAHYASEPGPMAFDAEARMAWAAVYEQLSEGKPGVFGAVTARAEAQALRLAMTYALLDCSREIRLPHLRAGLAVWQYCEDSARYIFGDAIGDKTADEILKLLRNSPDGCSRKQISEHFGNHKKSDDLTRVLTMLSERGLAERKDIPTSGRPIEMWFATGRTN